MVRNVIVKPGAGAKFEEFIGKYKEAAEKINAPYYWLASQAAVGGGDSYDIVLQFSSWKAFDNPRDVLKDAFGANEAKRLWSLLEDSAVSTTTAAYTANPELSRPAPQSNQAEVAVLLIHLTVRPGMDMQFYEYAKKVKEATDATAPNLYWTMLMPDIGASGPLVAIPISSWSDLDTSGKPIPQRLTEHLGAAEGFRVQAMGQAAVESLTTKVHRVRMDLARPQQ